MLVAPGVQQSWVVGAETLWLTEPKYLLSGPLQIRLASTYSYITMSVAVLDWFGLADFSHYCCIFSCFFGCLIIFDWMPDTVKGLEFSFLFFSLWISGDFSYNAVKLLGNVLILLGLGFTLWWLGPEQHLELLSLGLIILYYCGRSLLNNLPGNCKVFCVWLVGTGTIVALCKLQALFPLILLDGSSLCLQ